MGWNTIKVGKKEKVDIKENSTIESVQEEIHKVVEEKEKENTLGDIIIYSSPSCIKCRQLKSYIDTKGIKYEERDSHLHMKEIERVGLASLPIISIDSGEGKSYLSFEMFIEYLRDKGI